MIGGCACNISVQFNSGLLLPCVMVYYIVSGLLVQYNGGFLPDILLSTQCCLHRGTCLNAMKRFCICSLLIPSKRFDIFPPITGGCSEGLGVF